MVKSFKTTLKSFGIISIISNSLRNITQDAHVIPSSFFLKSKEKSKEKSKKEYTLSNISLRSKKINRNKSLKFNGISFTARQNLYWTPQEVLEYAIKYIMRYNPNIKKIADTFTAGEDHEYIRSRDYIQKAVGSSCKVIAPNKDFFKLTNKSLILRDVDLILSNPPYTFPRGIIKRILDHNFNIIKIPFAYLLPLRIMSEDWFYDLQQTNKLQIFFPNEKTVSFYRGKNYSKTNGGIQVIWLCWKCNLPFERITFEKNL
jgi:hypothetical protein